MKYKERWKPGGRNQIPFGAPANRSKDILKKEGKRPRKGGKAA